MLKLIAFIIMSLFVTFYYKWRFKDLHERDKSMKEWDDYLND